MIISKNADYKDYSDFFRLFECQKITKHQYINGMHGLHKSLFFYRSLIRKSEVASVEINDEMIIATMRGSNIKMLVDEFDSRFIPIEIINFGSFEAKEKLVIERIANCSPVILDIGANVGWYTLNFSKMKKVKKIFSFEAIPRTFDYLLKHLEINRVKTKVVAENKALLESKKNVTFTWTKEETGSASLINIQDRQSIEKISVQATSIDEYFLSRNIEVDLIKCDVEGSELLVMLGAKNYLTTFKPIIFCELLRKWSKKFGYHPNEVISFLAEFGYRCYEIEGNKIYQVELIDKNTVSTNFLFLNINRHENYIRDLTG